MPTFKVRTPDGQYFNVTVPPGTTKEQALAYAQANRPTPQGALDPAPIVHAPGTEPGGLYDRLKAANRVLSPKGFAGPGLLAKGGSALQGLMGATNPETPEQVYDRATPGMEHAVSILGSLIPGPQQATMVRRFAMGTAIPALLAGLGGKGLGGIQEGAGTGAMSQLGAEAIGGILKLPRLGSLANTARAEFDKKMAAHAAKAAHDQAMLRTLEEMDKGKYDALSAKAKTAHDDLTRQLMDEFAQKVSTHEDLMAGSIMDQAKKSVPSWRDFPSTLQGLLSATLGKGKEVLSASFDAALQAAKGAARDKTVPIPLQDAEKLGLPPVPRTIQDVAAMTSREANDLRLLVPVDAAELIDRLPGLKDKGLKSRAQQALYEADLGLSAEARAEYKVGKGTIALVDENKIFKFDPTTNTYRADRSALANGLLSRSHMDTIADREMGNFDSFPPLRVAEQGPLPPVIPPLKLPDLPAPRGPIGDQPLPIDPDVSGAIGTLHIPGTHYARAKVGAALGGVPGLALGAAIPKGITTKAPMSPQEDFAHQLLPALLGALFRTAGNSEATAAETAPATAIPGVTPAALGAMDAEIRAAELARATARDNPALQLDLTKP